MGIKYTKELLEPIVKECRSVRQVILKLGLAAAGGNYFNIKNKINQFDLSTSHFHGMLWNKGITGTTVLNINNVYEKLIENSFTKTGNPISTNTLKKQLLQFNIKNRVCEKCFNIEWCGKPIPLELHHMNGIKFDNRLENLQILCPNCHAQTDTYCGKNVKKKNPKVEIAKQLKDKSLKKEKFCSCGKQIDRRSTSCKRCWQILERKIERPPYEILLKEIEETNCLSVGRKYGVSDKAIRKWIKFYENSHTQ